MYEPETRPIWTDTEDEVYSEITKSFHTSNHATIWRWRNAFQNDFFARMDWCVAKKYTDANHPPKVTLKHPNEITVKSGSEVLLSSDATDPDKNELSYTWMFYKEVGSLNASGFSLQKPNSKEVKFVAPNVSEAKTMHFVLVVSDNGAPSLTRYQRVVVNVIPK